MTLQRVEELLINSALTGDIGISTGDILDSIIDCYVARYVGILRLVMCQVCRDPWEVMFSIMTPILFLISNHLNPVLTDVLFISLPRHTLSATRVILSFFVPSQL